MMSSLRILHLLIIGICFVCINSFTIITPSPSSSIILNRNTKVISFPTSQLFIPTHNNNKRMQSLIWSSTTDNDGNEPNSQDASRNEPIDVSVDPRLYRVRISRAVGIDWGTDLSFSFVYVRGIDPTGAAAMTGGQIKVGDQLCELIPVSNKPEEEPINLIGTSFDMVMSTFANLDRTVTEVDLVFFRGTKKELKELCADGTGTAIDPDTITVTVIQNKGAKDERTVKLTAPAGVNVRELLVNNNINVYQSVTRWTNCKGKQLCGTCIVNITDGSIQTNRKSMDESSTLRENPDSYRLSCITFAYGDITVETFPPIKAAQWTR